ncbi:AraC family transcriptional regulator [Bradyrhizobium sp. B097]|uniref:helix-turn-helix domain-containing protein n=1 Tax=Bradyrhizobium sp. B097 TaxID=3140244 RepID=UPI003183E699
MVGSTFIRPAPKLASAVEAIWDVDVPAAEATALTVRVLPTVFPLLVVHYRDPMVSDRPGKSGHYRQVVTGVQSRAITIRPLGSIGAALVRLRPEAASLLFGEALHEFTDVNIPLSDVFGTTRVSLLGEALAEARSAAARAEVLEDFLTGQMRDRAPDPLVRRAVLDLLGDPRVSVRQLASQLDISERQLSRRFKLLVGTNPKQFARVVRMGNVIGSRRFGGAWADIAYACGFNDQAHLVNEFKSMTGKPPGAFFRAAATPEHQRLNASLATSDFYNTFVA